MQKVSEYRYEETLCLKGYLKSFYLRAIYRRSELVRTCALFHIMHIIFCLLITPLYFGFISNFMGFSGKFDRFLPKIWRKWEIFPKL